MKRLSWLIALLVGLVACGNDDEEAVSPDGTSGAGGEATETGGAAGAETGGVGTGGGSSSQAGTAGAGNVTGSQAGAAGRPTTSAGGQAGAGGGPVPGGAGSPDVAGGSGGDAGDGGEAGDGATTAGAGGVGGAGGQGPIAAPFNVTVTLDTDHAVSALIPRDGGSLTAVAADGTELSLTIPADALLSSELITLTPLLEIDELPFSGGLVAGAHFEPEGLLLLEPATLTITPSDLPSADELIGFSYTQSGSNLLVAPISVAGAALEMPILHFSGAGAARGTAGEGSGHAGRSGSSPQDQATQALANLLRQSQSRGEGPNDDELNAAEQILRDWYTGSVMPNLRAAQGDDGLLRAAIAEMLAWYQNVILFGLEDRFTSEWQDALDAARTGLLNAIRRSHDRCISGPDASEVVTIMRWGEIGMRLTVLDTPEFEDDVRACATFELDVSSHFQRLGETPFNGTVQVSSMVLTLDESLIMFTGTAPSDYLSASVEDECVVSVTPTGATADASMTMNLNFKESGDPGIQMYFWPGTPSEALTIQCPTDDAPTYLTARYWFSGWLAGHQAEAEGNGMLDWDFSGANYFASKVYGGVVSGEGVDFQETTRLDLYHTPQ